MSTRRAHYLIVLQLLYRYLRLGREGKHAFCSRYASRNRRISVAVVTATSHLCVIIRLWFQLDQAIRLITGYKLAGVKIPARCQPEIRRRRSGKAQRRRPPWTRFPPKFP